MRVSNYYQPFRHMLLSITLILTFVVPRHVLANASWNGVLKSVRVHPRINVVHIDTNNIATQYYFLAAVPMVIFHYGDTVYSSVLITDDILDPTAKYLLDDWKAYLVDQPHANNKRYVNFIGGVSSDVQDSILKQFEIADADFDVITGTPEAIASSTGKPKPS